MSVKGIYENENKKNASSKAVIKIRLFGYHRFTVYIRSSSANDYMIASILDAAEYPTGYTDSTTKEHTKNNPHAGNKIEDYTKVEYELDGGEHWIYLVYVVGNAIAGESNGYFLIQMDE